MDKIRRIIEKIERCAAEEGLEVVDLDIKKSKTPFIEVTVDKKGSGISSEECGSLNRKIRAFLEELDVFPSGYTIDVCSPGLDRVIKSEREYRWAVGKDVIVSLHAPFEGQNVFSGKLMEVTPDGKIVLRQQRGEDLEFEKKDAANIKLGLKI